MKTYFFLASSLFLVLACSKDKEIVPPKAPFIEYRDPYTGTFIGTMIKQHVMLSVPSGPPDTTLNSVITLSRSSDNDSTMLMKWPYEEIVKAGPGGKFTAIRTSWPSFSLVFRNDSLFFNGYNGGASSAFTYRYKGKRL